MDPTDLSHLQLGKMFSGIFVCSPHAVDRLDFILVSVYFGGQKLDFGVI